MIQANQKYNVEITAASLVRSQAKGTLGLQLSLETENSDSDSISHTIWITTESLGSAEKALSAIGVSAQDIKKKIFWENVGSIICGRKASVTTIEKEWKGKKQVVVQWLNAANAVDVDVDMASAAADMFDAIPF